MEVSVLRVGSSIPQLQSDGGALGSDPAFKAALFSDFLDVKLFRDVVCCPASCHRRHKLCTFDFRSR